MLVDFYWFFFAATACVGLNFKQLQRKRTSNAVRWWKGRKNDRKITSFDVCMCCVPNRNHRVSVIHWHLRGTSQKSIIVFFLTLFVAQSLIHPARDVIKYCCLTVRFLSKIAPTVAMPFNWFVVCVCQEVRNVAIVNSRVCRLMSRFPQYSRQTFGERCICACWGWRKIIWM